MQARTGGPFTTYAEVDYIMEHHPPLLSNRAFAARKKSGQAGPPMMNRQDAKYAKYGITKQKLLATLAPWRLNLPSCHDFLSSYAGTQEPMKKKTFLSSWVLGFPRSDPAFFD